MQPSDDQDNQGGALDPALNAINAHGTPVQRTRPRETVKQRDAAVDLLRSKIDTLFDPNAETIDPQDPYERTASTALQPTTNDWQEYHTAWQNYYQKYYEAYYTQTAEQPAAAAGNYFTQPEPEQQQSTIVSQDEALFDLRQKLRSRIQESAKKVRRSRHFVPVASAVLVVIIFAFLQYNRLIIANVVAYVSPGSIDPQNIVVNPSADASVSGDPRLIIPKINVDVPVVYGIGNDYASQMKAMENGVAHFGIPGANSRPGELGNTVISGHSSNDLFDGGDYKFVFAQLEKLKTGDTIYANYEGTRYTYVITKMEVVKPTEVSKLVYTTDIPVLTLITCTPLGTALNRLLVTAEQVAPDPSAAKQGSDTSASGDTSAIPGNSPSLIERIFGAR